MDYTVTLFEVKDRIARITLNRPQKLNAVAPPMVEELLDQIERVKKDDGIRALVVTGAGRGFCAGDDIEYLAKAFSEQSQPARPRGAGPLAPAFRSLEKPTIAMVNGVAVGIGCDLALLCDFIVASEKAAFGEFYIRRGIVPSAGNWLLPRIVGLKQACRMLMLGDLLDAREAERIGITYKVVPHERLEEETLELARRLAETAPTALSFTKHAIYHGLEWDLETALDYVAYARSVASRSGEVKEGVQAFREKRASQF